MSTRPCSAVVNQGRCQLLIAIAMGIAVAVAVGSALATRALAQTVTSADQIEHHIAKIDGTRFHYVTAGSGDPVLLLPGVARKLDRLAQGSAFTGQRWPQCRRTRSSWFR
jgi:hypothetical protein